MGASIDPGVQSDLAPAGVIRAAINLGNTVLAQRDAATGAPCGVSVDLAQEVARRLGVGVELVLFDAAGKVFEALPQVSTYIEEMKRSGFVANALRLSGQAMRPSHRITEQVSARRRQPWTSFRPKR